LAALLDVDKQIQILRPALERLLQQRRKLAVQFKEANTEDKQKLQQEAHALATEIASRETALQKYVDELNALMLLVPNLPMASAPQGASDKDNIVIETGGTKPAFTFPVRDHVTLMELNDWGDFPRIAKVAGARSYVLKGDLALLEMGLWTLALREMQKTGFIPITVPAMAREKALVATGHFPTGREDVFRIPEDDLYLNGTAEVVLTSLHADEILAEDQLPLCYAGFSPCFRREAGSAGRDVRGLLRVHQFYKVEQFVICRDAAEAEHWHQQLLAFSKHMLDLLGLHYQVVECCTGDMGVGKYRMNDIETWLPSAARYRETHSCSTLHEWQARRANLRYRTRQGEVRFAHTLNNTALATPRILAQLLETHQQQDGRVWVPPALREFVRGAEYIGGQTLMA